MVFIISNEDAIRLYPVLEDVVGLLDKLKNALESTTRSEIDLDPESLRRLERFNRLSIVDV